MERLIKLRLIHAQYEKYDIETLRHVISELYDEIDKLEVGLYER
jgi:uncharacterized protein YqfB (UPF0267 family)